MSFYRKPGPKENEQQNAQAPDDPGFNLHLGVLTGSLDNVITYAQDTARVGLEIGMAPINALTDRMQGQQATNTVEQTRLKCMLVGDSTTSHQRTAFAHAFTEGKIESTRTARRERHGSVSETFTASTTLDGKIIVADVWLGPNNENIRQMLYPGTNVCICLCDCISVRSLDVLWSTIGPELARHVPTIQYVVVAVNAHLSEEVNAQSREIARKLAAEYVEMDDLTLESVRGVFHTALSLAMKEDLDLLQRRRNAIANMISQTNDHLYESPAFSDSELASLKESISTLDRKIRLKQNPRQQPPPKTIGRKVSALFGLSKENLSQE